MTNQIFTVRPEVPADKSSIDTLVANVFGPAMFVRAAYLLREGVPHAPNMAFVAVSVDDDGADTLLGTVRMTKVRWGKDLVWMLGPLAVLKAQHGRGAGKALMHKVVEVAKSAALNGGLGAIVLVGDLDYYAQFGFTPISRGRCQLPRPTDPGRILACDLIDGATSKMQGPVERAL